MRDKIDSEVLYHTMLVVQGSKQLRVYLMLLAKPNSLSTEIVIIMCMQYVGIIEFLALKL